MSSKYQGTRDEILAQLKAKQHYQQVRYPPGTAPKKTAPPQQQSGTTPASE